MQLENATVLKNEPRDGGYFLLELDAPATSASAQPGQFSHLRIPNRSDLILRRPFSIFKAENGTLSFLYKVVGQGTEQLSRLTTDSSINVLGPLGTGFPAPNTSKTPVLVAGGYGMAALYLTAQRSPAKGIVFAGGRTARDILCTKDFEALGWQIELATEDGSLGTEGLVTQPLNQWLDQTKTDAEFFVCGPMGMLKAIGDLAQENDLTAWLSLDHYMACGMGACLTCVQKIKKGAEEKLLCTCTDGPVFECREIVWENK